MRGRPPKFKTDTVSRDDDGIDTNAVMTIDQERTHLLDVETRNDILINLKNLGYVPDDNVSDADLIAKLSLLAKNTHNKNIELEAKYLSPTLTSRMNSISEMTGIKDMDFCERLATLFHADYSDYIRLFTEDDVKLTDEQIWKKVRNSGINRASNMQDLFKSRYTEEDLETFKRGVGVTSHNA